MAQRFIKGRTNNHLSWVMVDATDFATPESAMSNITKLTIYGKVAGATTLYTVSTGTGSLTNDIVHVGPSATGAYTIALAKADLSDASQAWYDQYIVAISATGAAHQILVVDGGIYESYFSNLLSNLSNYESNLSGIASDILSAARGNSDAISNVLSYLAVMSGVQSDVYSLLSDTRSTMDSQFLVSSNYLSYLSNTVSGLGAGNSTSAIAAKVWSDYESKVGLTTSDLNSKLRAGGGGATTSAIADKVWSDFNSKVGRTVSDAFSELIALSDAISNVQSYLAVMSGVQSDMYSALSDARSTMDSQFAVSSNYFSYLSNAVSDIQSDFQSRVPKAVATNSQLSQLVSDLDSRLTALSTTTSAISAKVWSDYESKVGITVSNLNSKLQAGGGGATASNIADKVWSDFQSKVGRTVSDVMSELIALSDAVSNVQSYLAVMSGVQSDVYSLLSDTRSTMDSQFAVTSNYLSNISAQHSDTYSYLNATYVTLSDMISDVKSRVVADSSNIVSMLTVLDDYVDAEVAQINSRVLLTQSMASVAGANAALLTTAHAEPTGVPAANATPLNKLGYVFAALRNKVTVTSTKMQFFDDADAALWEKDLSDDGTTYTESEGNAP